MSDYDACIDELIRRIALRKGVSIAEAERIWYAENKKYLLHRLAAEKSEQNPRGALAAR